MKIVFDYNNNIINEGIEDDRMETVKKSFQDEMKRQNAGFRSYDKVIGPDGTIYNPKYIISLVNNACDMLTEITQGTITKFLGALPILYTFSVETMATDTDFIYINPGFVMWLFEATGHTTAGIAFVIMHEVYHNLFMHHAREKADPAKYSDHKRANAAQDYEINWVIEHSFPDMRSPEEAEADGETVYDENGNRIQIMEGITKACKGLIDKKYANMCWEDIYPLLTEKEMGDNDSDNNDDTEQEVIQTSKDFDDGYRDGWNDVIREARAKGLVESVITTDGFISQLIKLFEAVQAGKSQDYDTGYALGRQKALQILMSLADGNSAGGQQQGIGQNQPVFNPIDGLETMKPKNVDADAAQKASSGKQQDPNTPVDMSNSNSGGSNGDQKQNNQNQNSQSNQQQGNSGNQQSSQSGQQSGQEGGQQSGQQGGQDGGQQGSQDGQSGSQSGQQGGQQGAQSGSQSGQQGGDSAGSDGSSGQSSSGQGNSNSKGGKNGDQGDDTGYGDGNGEDGQSSDGGTFDDIKHGNSGSAGDPYKTRSDSTPGDGDYSDKTTSARQEIEKMYDGRETVKVGVADGKFTGKTGAANGVHHISQEEGRRIQKQAGYDKPKDKNYSGRAEENPFTEGNWEALEKAINGMEEKALIGANPGSGRNSTLSAVANKLREVMTPLVDWREEMKNRLDACFSELVDVGWNKKGITRDIYTRFDDYEGDNLQNLIIMIDTSGSVEGRPEFLKQIISEFNDIGRKVNPKCIDLVLFNDGVYYEEKIEDEDAPDLSDVFKKHMVSGGTTYMECFKYIQEEYIDGNETFACCVIFTDTDITYNTAHQIPKEEDLEWDPGHEGDDNAKLLWFILNDSKEHIEMPYGGLIEVSHDQFEKSLKNNFVTTNEAVKPKVVIPRRNINNNDMKINEAYFKNIDAEKAKRAAAAAASEEVPPADSTEAPAEVPAAPAKKRIVDPERQRYNIIKSLRAGGKIDEYKKLVKDWVIAHTNVARNDFDGYYPKAEITDDLYVNVKKDLTIMGDDLANMEPYVSFKQVDGSLTVGGSRYLDALPGGLPRIVTGDFVCINLPNITSLFGGPGKVGGNYIVNGCTKLATLDGAPRSLDDFTGYFLSDSDFTNEDFYNTIENGGLMANSEYEYTTPPVEEAPAEEPAAATPPVEESVKTDVDINSIVESRLALAKKFNAGSLNEAFTSRILSRLAKNPDNKDALETMKSMKVFWSEIPDEIITSVYGSVTKVIQARRVINRDTSKFGITICCDANDKINVIGTGDNQGDWRGNTWLYLAPGLLSKISERANLVSDANSPRKSEEDKQKAQRECERLGINWEKSDIIRLGRVQSKDDLRFPHMYLIPEYCAKSYVIKGMDDSKSAASKDPEFVRNFSYKSQNTRRNELARSRREAIAGQIVNPVNRTVNTVDDEGRVVKKLVPYSLRNRMEDPAYKKYANDFIDADLLKRLQEAHGSHIALKRCIEGMLDSVKTNMRKVRRSILALMNEGTMDEELLDAIQLRFLLGSYNQFKNAAEQEITRLDNRRKTETQPYVDKLIRGKDTTELDDDGNPIQLSLLGTRKKSWDSSPKATDIYKQEGYYTEKWYVLYTKTIKGYAKLMAKIDAVRRGHPEELEEYARDILRRSANWSLD